MLNKTNITSESCNFLDLDIPPYEGKFNIHVYHKRHARFFPHQFSFLERDAHLIPSYGVYISVGLFSTHLYYCFWLQNHVHQSYIYM